MCQDKSGEIKPSQVGPWQAKLGHVNSRQAKVSQQRQLVKGKSGQGKSGQKSQVKKSQGKSGYVKQSGQDKLGQDKLSLVKASQVKPSQATSI